MHSSDKCVEISLCELRGLYQQLIEFQKINILLKDENLKLLEEINKYIKEIKDLKTHQLET